MSYDKNEEIINKLIKESQISGSGINVSGKGDIEKMLGSIDRNAAERKLRSMGLGSVADKLKTVSDKELIDMIAKNPSILKKINSLLK
ncbi:MAG: hypothetical protein E7395_08560 [Ruminococcaceae bacterium]|nr:hypothetical protein [Oscillospiraceae bacterium]